MTKKLQAQADKLAADNDKDTLVAMASERGLDTTGTKAELAASIVQYDDTDDGDEEIESDTPTPPSEHATVEQRIKNLEAKTEANYKQFVEHTHRARDGAVELGQSDEDKAKARKLAEVDQTQEAGMRQKALARREKFIKSGGDPTHPVPEEVDETENTDKEGEEDPNTDPNLPETTAINPQATGK